MNVNHLGIDLFSETWTCICQYIINIHRNYTGFWKPSSWMQWNCLSKMVHILTAEDLASQGASASTAKIVMASSNGNIFHVTVHLYGKFTGDRWIPRTKVTRIFDVFLDLRLNERLSKQSWGWWLETPSRSSRRHCNVMTEFAGNNPVQEYW